MEFAKLLDCAPVLAGRIGSIKEKKGRKNPKKHERSWKTYKPLGIKSTLLSLQKEIRVRVMSSDLDWSHTIEMKSSFCHVLVLGLWKYIISDTVLA
jgi:hypothetical protein